jgi:anaerobic magnesium-protoporphyrin IX monomethyl ester cyclase
MKILFISTIDENRKIASITNIPQFGTLYLTSYLTAHGYRDEDIEVREWGHLHEDEFRRIKPDIVGISSISQHWGVALDLERSIHAIDPQIMVVFGGFHISALPHNLPPNSHNYAVIGEGEETMLDLVWWLDPDNDDDPRKTLDKIEGIAYYDYANHLSINKPRPPIADLDEIPFPARHKVKYTPSMTHTMVTSRGCMYACPFCNSAAFWKGARYRTAGNVADELEQVLDTYKPPIISISDDLFVGNRPRLREMARIFRERGLVGRTKFIVSARADLMDDEVASLCKQIGVSTINMGLESGSPRILHWLKAGTTTVHQNREAVRVVNAHGMETFGTFVMGAPMETDMDLAETYTFIKHSGLTAFEMYMLTPYPGTPLWNYAKAKGLVSDNMDFSKLEMFYGDDPRYAVSWKDRILVSEMRREDLLHWYDEFKALAKWFRQKRLAKRAVQVPQNAPKYRARLIDERKRLSKIGREE